MLGEVVSIQCGVLFRLIVKYIIDDEDGVFWIKIGDILFGLKYVICIVQKIILEGVRYLWIFDKGDFIMFNFMSFG